MAVEVVFRGLFVFFLATGCSGVIDDACIKCLCEAINEGPICNYQDRCHDGVCGPYAITMPYWVDAGRPTAGLDDRNQPSTYEKCAMDITCAEATIRGYMNKFHQDCDRDGFETCFDYAKIHFHGGYNCKQPLRGPVRNALGNCLARFEAPSVPDLEPRPDLQTIPPTIPPTTTPYPEIDIRFKDDK